ncbi:aminotransferase class I/II-fold pyridoxal phosphate-dependent enzyme, partial [Roseisolibacter sp. H3M3-2]|uniref:aminotransferase class I/II-fold pyridoxal phosphate-dependent enzyme n=1 Tax=Roseisolibacter sp. H3M3-2 TaxID=3031323 RepID=UPI0023DA301D
RRGRAVARRLREELVALGHASPGEPDGHVVPVPIGDPRRTVAVGDALRAGGFLVGAIRPPTVPPGGSRLRVSASAAHTDAEVDGLLAALAAALRERA